MLFRIQKPNRLRKLLLTDFTEKCKNKKIDEFLVKKSIFKICREQTKNRAAFLVYRLVLSVYQLIFG
jgi:hypothetical protein